MRRSKQRGRVGPAQARAGSPWSPLHRWCAGGLERVLKKHQERLLDRREVYGEAVWLEGLVIGVERVRPIDAAQVRSDDQ